MILGLTIYFVNSKLTKNNFTSFVITIGAMYLLRDYIAARAQLVTFILFLLTVYYIEMFLETKKKRYVVGLIVIPILIANLHLAVFPFYFILYLPYIAEYIVHLLSRCGIIVNKNKVKKLHKKIINTDSEKEVKNIKNKIKVLNRKIEKQDKKYKTANENPYKIIINANKAVKILVIIMIICLFTGFLTPLKGTPYTYLVKTIKGTTTHNISEHLPLTLVNNLEFMAVIIVFLSILIFTDTKIKLRDLFMLLRPFTSFFLHEKTSINVCINMFCNTK